MSKSQGKESKTGLYWCNIVLSTGKYKLVVAELIDSELMIFKLWSNHSQMKLLPDWTECENRQGWYLKECFEDSINEFFNF